MGLFDNGGRVWLGIGLGAGAVVSAPYLLPVVGAITRPLLKVLLLQSALAFERGREVFAQLAESLEDLVAEVRTEVDEKLAARAEHQRGTAPAAAPPPTEPAHPARAHGAGLRGAKGAA
jgi:hypothetical protein